MGVDLSAGRHVISLGEGPAKRQYIVRVPTSYRGSATPLVMVLHGWTSSAAAAEVYTGMAEKAEREGFIAIFPDGVGRPQGWNTGFINLTGRADVDDVGFLSQVLDDVEKKVKVDADRVYICGHSNGAMMTNTLAAKLSNRVAAVASVAGTIGVGKKTIPDPQGAVPVLLIHGRDDKTVAYDPAERNALLLGVGAVDSAKWWAKKNGTSPDPERVEQGKLIIEKWKGAKPRQDVTLVTILGLKHDWPGGLGLDSEGRPVQETTSGVKAADLIWDFFRTHSRRR